MSSDEFERLRIMADAVMAAEAAQRVRMRAGVLVIPAGADEPTRCGVEHTPAEATVLDGAPPLPPPSVAPAAAPRGPKGRFAPGASGNIKGRPKRRERAHIASQMSEDVIYVMEKPVSVRRSNGKSVMLPPILALLEQLSAIALTSKEANIKLQMVDRYEKSLKANERSIPVLMEALQKLGELLHFETDPVKRKDLEEWVEHYRRMTRPGTKLKR